MRSITQILQDSRTVAVVGASADPTKAAHTVPLALQRVGFRIIPVNPAHRELFGEPVYPTLTDIPSDIGIDIVNVFRPGPLTPPFAQQAVQVAAKVLWLQLGIASTESRLIAEAAGLDYVEDHCIKVEVNSRVINHASS